MLPEHEGVFLLTYLGGRSAWLRILQMPNQLHPKYLLKIASYTEIETMTGTIRLQLQIRFVRLIITSIAPGHPLTTTSSSAASVWKPRLHSLAKWICKCVIVGWLGSSSYSCTDVIHLSGSTTMHYRTAIVHVVVPRVSAGTGNQFHCRALK